MSQDLFRLSSKFQQHLLSALEDENLDSGKKARIQALLALHSGQSPEQVSTIIGLPARVVSRLAELAVENGVAVIRDALLEGEKIAELFPLDDPDTQGVIMNVISDPPVDDLDRSSLEKEKWIQGVAKTWCPYLGTEDDLTTAFRFPSEMNRCNKNRICKPVTLIHQENFCLTENYQACPVFSPTWNGRFPKEILPGRNPVQELRSWLLSGIVFLAVGILVLGLILQAFIPRRTMLAMLRETITAGVTSTSILAARSLEASQAALTVEQVVPAFPSKTPASPTSSLTLESLNPPVAIQPTSTPLPTNTRTPTKTAPLPTPTVTPTPSPIPTMTPGPAPGTPFSTEPLLLIHIIRPYDSYTLLANQFQTSIRLLEYLNPRRVGQALWDGQPVVIAPGRVEIGDLPRFRVLQLDKAQSLADLAQAFQADASEIKRYNNLGDDPEIPAGRWLVIPLPPE